ncbi:MAG: bifunctional metallophosphatase/5'-nucleotidase, partial [Lentisphaeria bacterium]|nr:bifunctional metallophosphatase/5'-nucleotidase [Lentisphaeria bacterium]
LLVFGAVFCCFAEIRTVTVLLTTDLHGSTEMPGIVSFIRQRKAVDPEVLVIDCGDLTQGTYEAAQDQGASMAGALEFAGYDVFVPGNHDFDYGPDVLKRNLARFRHVQVLASNLKLDGIPQKGWALFVRNGVRIAVIGIVPPYLFQWIANSRLRGVSVGTVENGIARVMPEIRRAGAELVILAIHLGEFTSGRLNPDGKKFALSSVLKKYPEITLVLAGHTHQTIAGKRLYPGAWLVQPAFHAGSIAEIRVMIDPEKRQTLDISSTLHPLPDPVSAPVMPEDWVQNLATARTGRETVHTILPAGFAFTPFRNSKDPGTFALLCARAMAEFAGTDLAFSPSYSSATVSGRVTEFDLYRLIPFENYVTILTLTPEQLDAVLQEQNGLKGVSRRSKQLLYPGDFRPQERYTVAFGSYAVSGAGGRFPVLKQIAESGTVERRDLEWSVRDAFRDFLRKNDLTKIVSDAKVKTDYRNNKE